ncbi:MAG TPA: quinoprotein relay system zinc metallohydrolase 2 [Burkholderiales bacterium]|nr:quinoprotein relay system zinc metallohydrolase 2 [Burkholderiales bacterium]
MNRIKGTTSMLVTVVVAIARTSIAAEPAQIGNFEVTEVAPGNYVHYGTFAERSPGNLGDNANIGFIVGQRCVLVVDAGGSLSVGRALKTAIRRVTQTPICHVVLTHVHPDHFFGAAAFLDDGAQFVAHRNYPRQIAARARSYLNYLRRDLGAFADGSEIVQPTLLVTDRLELDLGGRTVVVQGWPPAHTDDDLTVFDRATRTFWLADLLFVDHTPVIDGTITGFLAVMDDLRKVDAVHYVAGHGYSRTPWPQVLEAQRRYFSVILEETRTAIRDRKTIQQATDEVGLSEAKNWAAFDTFHRRNVTTAYTELEWE